MLAFDCLFVVFENSHIIREEINFGRKMMNHTSKNKFIINTSSSGKSFKNEVYERREATNYESDTTYEADIMLAQVWLVICFFVENKLFIQI